MTRKQVLRLALVLFALAAVGAIYFSYFDRQKEIRVPEGRMLSPQVSRQSTRFEYTEHKRGRPVFRVYAATSTETVNQVHTLQGVQLDYYDDTGAVTDTISGEKASYLVADKRVEFAGNTRLDLSDGTRLFSDTVGADLAAELATAPGRFRFERGDIRGSGRVLEYDFQRRILKVHEGLSLESTGSGAPVSAASREARYPLHERSFRLSGSARINTPRASLLAGWIDLKLSGTGRIERVDSGAGAELKLGRERRFSGEQIRMVNRAGQDGVERFVVLGKGAGLPAAFSESAPGRRFRVSADRIEGRPDSEGAFLESVTADGDVEVRAPELQVSRARAGGMTVQFFPGSETMEEAVLSGDVEVQLEGGPDSHRSVKSRSLKLRFLRDQQLDQVKALGDVLVQGGGKDSLERLQAKESVEMDYEAGRMKTAVALGGCRIETEQGGTRRTLEAPRVRLTYRSGVITAARAWEGVETLLEDSGSVWRTRSRQLDGAFRRGVLEELVQTSDVRIWSEDPSHIEFRSEEATYRPEPGVILISGRTPPVLTSREKGAGLSSSDSRTRAGIFEVDLASNKIQARGDVESTLIRPGDPLVVTSQKMDYQPDGGSVLYRGNPRVQQQERSVTGERVSYNLERQQLEVDGNVVSEWPSLEEGQPAYSITADRLRYEEVSGLALYEGEVTVQSEELVLEAPSVEFALATGGSAALLKIEAWGGVRIRDGERTAEGDRAVHYPAEGKMVISGNPAQVTEHGAGRAEGQQLTFFVGEDSLLVEGSQSSVQP